MLSEDVEVVPIQILRHLGICQHLLLEVLAPVTPDGADEEEDRFAVPLRGVEYRRGMLHELHLRGVMGLAPGMCHGKDCGESEREDGQQAP